MPHNPRIGRLSKERFAQDDNGVFLYTGEGQKGDMDFVPGNRAIRHHALDGKDIHLFQALGRGEGYRYLGRFACSTWELRKGTDLYRDERRVIVFRLIQPEDDDEPIGLLPHAQHRSTNCDITP